MCVDVLRGGLLWCIVTTGVPATLAEMAAISVSGRVLA